MVCFVSLLLIISFIYYFFLVSEEEGIFRISASAATVSEILTNISTNPGMLII